MWLFVFILLTVEFFIFKFEILIMICLGLDLLRFILFGDIVLGYLCPSLVWGNFQAYVSQVHFWFSSLSPSLLSFWGPYNTNTGILFLTFIFNWLMIDLQYWFDFCHISNELTIGAHMSPPSWISLQPPAHGPSRLLQIPSLVSLSHAASSHWLSIYMY